MNLRSLKDNELLQQTRQLIEKERLVLTQILHHLREVERRKLFSELGYQSLFEYCIKDLKYSEGQASRRIGAMRLIVEIPEIEKKLETGSLSLTNVSMAQTYFREKKKMDGGLNVQAKREVLQKLENKSAREGQKVIGELQPSGPLPKESERQVGLSHLELKIVITSDVREKLEEVRSLLGPKGTDLSVAELVAVMAELSVESLSAKKFGKRRTEVADATPALEKPSVDRSRNARHIPRAVRYQVWQRDRGKCCRCGSKRNLNFDHVLPVALGGDGKASNIRLLCFHCNQRQAIKTFEGYGQRDLMIRSTEMLEC